MVAACMSASLCAVVSAQTVVGIWQGLLPVAENSHIAVKIAKADDASLQGVLYLMDKGPDVIGLTSVSFTAPNLRLEQVNLDFSYTGRLNADGRSIDGVWRQKSQSYPLTLALAGPEAIRKPGSVGALPRMSPDADPAFEVATIKPTPPDAKGSSMRLRTRQFAASNQSVEDLLEFAYHIRGRQISGGSSWVREARFDIAGEPDTPGLPAVDQYRGMVKKLLANRFQLQSHIEQREFPVYALTADKASTRLNHSDPEFDSGSIYVKDGPDGESTGHFLGLTMPMFADILMNFIQDRQIVDETGLTGHFEFTMRVPTSATHGGQASGPGDESADEFMLAMQPLGLKLVPKTAPVRVVVIDSIQKPSEN